MEERMEHTLENQDKEALHIQSDKFKYRNEEERTKTMNRFMIMGSAVLFGVYMLYLFFKLGVGGIAKPTVYGNVVLMLFFWVVLLIRYQRNPVNLKLKTWVYISFGIEYLLMALQTDAEFINPALLGMLVSCIPYYEKKFFKRLGFSYLSLYVICLSVRMAKNMTTLDVNFVCVTLTMLLLFYTVMRIGTISKIFSDDALGAIGEQSKRQKMMMEEILTISRTVQEQTEQSHDRMQNLHESSSTVNRSMQRIVAATGTTSDSIQKQTLMTQDIQNAIEETASHSKKMVEVARESNEDVQKNIQIIEELKQQSAKISETNKQVTESMEGLIERTREVQNIAGTIAGISSQTNLLALNASIESARAGEAGRGFAVVAEQIRQLAEQTKASTETISSILNELNTDAGQVVSAVKSSVEATGKQGEMIVMASEVFEKVDANLEMLVNDVHVVDKRVLDLSGTNNRIVENISQISANTEEITANAEEAGNLAEQTLNQAIEVRESIDIIRAETDNLNKYF